MPTWEQYPADYRQSEVSRILEAIRAGECVSVVGLSGAGKSNLMGFLFHRRNPGNLVLIDGNRARPATAEGLFRLAHRMLTPSEAPAAVSTGDAFPALEDAVDRRLQSPPGTLGLFVDRYDALDPQEQQLCAAPLRALRDAHKYDLAYVIATRHPLGSEDELAELFYAHTLWLGPLSPSDARWSAGAYAQRRGLAWDETTIARLIELSWGYPSLLRACCEAFAAGSPLDPEILRAHPAVRSRVDEFWASRPSADEFRLSGLRGHPLLGEGPATVDAGSPELTAGEHHLLSYFQAHPGEVCEKDDLIAAVWPEDRVAGGLRDDSLAQLIRRLRLKIGAERIQTVPGRGYRYRV